MWRSMARSRDLKPLFWFAWALVTIAIVYGLCSCKTQRQIQTEYVYIQQTDTLSQVKWRVDSINVHDSIVTLIKGDTVITDRWHTAYRDRLRVDTIEKIRTETIYNTKTETKIQEVNRLYWWQKALMWIGGTGLALLVILILVAIFTIKKWIKGK